MQNVSSSVILIFDFGVDHLISLVTGWMFLLNGTESDCNPIKHFTQKFNKMYFFGSAHSKFGGGVFSILVSFFFDFFA